METLYIPVNIKTRLEFFDGFGLAELSITAIVTATCGVLAFLLHLATGSVTVPVLLTIITLAATVMITAKDQYNQSMVDHIRNLLRFAGGQQKYQYCYMEEWGL